MVYEPGLRRWLLAFARFEANEPECVVMTEHQNHGKKKKNRKRQKINGWIDGRKAQHYYLDQT